MTLIEVIAGLILLGTVVGMMLLARGRIMTKAVEAERRRVAVTVLDGLVSQWWANPQTLPRSARGDRDGWTWQTTTVPTPAATAIGGDLVRVAISDSRGIGATLDILVPLPPKKGTTRAAAK